MKKIVLCAAMLLAIADGVAAATANGSSALALAALVADQSPLLTARERGVMARLFNGYLNVSVPANRKIVVKANAIACRASNVDITARSCELKFGTRQLALRGRRAHELFATLAEVGVPPDGAAGSVFERLSNLVCTIDVKEIQQKAGGGATCTFDRGGP
jgi:hypothetical protein